MRQVLTLPTDLLPLLDEYKDFVIQNRPDKLLPNWRTKGKFLKEGRPEYATSLDCLKSMNVQDHDGFPPDSFGYDLNAPTLQKTLQMESLPAEEQDWIHKYIEKSNELDDTLGAYIGYKFCALKMFYPEESQNTKLDFTDKSSRFTYSVHARFGIRNYAFFASYNLNSLFRNKKSTNINWLQFGISLSLF